MFVFIVMLLTGRKKLSIQEHWLQRELWRLHGTLPLIAMLILYSLSLYPWGNSPCFSYLLDSNVDQHHLLLRYIKTKLTSSSVSIRRRSTPVTSKRTHKWPPFRNERQIQKSLHISCSTFVPSVLIT